MGEPYKLEEGREDDAGAPPSQWATRGRVAAFSLLCSLIVLKLCLDILVEVVYLRYIHDRSGNQEFSPLTL